MSDPFAPITGGTAAPKKQGSGWVSVQPVPDDAPPPPDAHPTLGRPTRLWPYADTEGRLMGFACRFDGADGKQFRPLTLWRPEKGGKAAWRWEAWPGPRPLYALDRLADSPRAPVIVLEGEKAADAAARLLPGFVAITSPNGSKSGGKADWSPLAGRKVTIWPDADDAGAAYATAVADLAKAAGAVSVAILAPPEGVPGGWDAADAEADGWDAARAEAFIATARAVVSLDAARAAKAKAAKPKQARRKADGDGTDGGEPRTRRVPQRDQLMGLTSDIDLWHDQAGECYASFPVNAHRENWPIKSMAFRRWLAVRAFEATGAVPGGQAIEDTLRVLEARAYSEGPERVPCLRAGIADGRAYLDLCDAAWRAVEIEPDGWRIVSKPPVAFVRTGQMRPLPEPEGGYEIDDLRRFLNVASDEDFALLCAWLLATTRAEGPYPILVFTGEQGTGKSTASRLIRGLVDPNAAPIRAVPRDDRDLIVGAVNSHVMAFDNLSSVPNWLSDALCRLATGGGFSSRQLHTDREETVLQAVKPIILNGIPALTDRPDLADRAVTVRLRPIAESERRPEAEFWTEWDAVAPRVLGALLDAFAVGLRRQHTVKLDRLPRMADFARWGAACETGLGFEPGSFIAAYAANRSDVAETTFEADPVATAIRDLISNDCLSGWHGTPSELLSALNIRVADSVKRLKLWPQTPQSLGTRIDRIAPLLRQQGFAVDRKHSGTRVISIAPVPQ